jgi:formylmethanofuran dehydrogenase subunit E
MRRLYPDLNYNKLQARARTHWDHMPREERVPYGKESKETYRYMGILQQMERDERVARELQREEDDVVFVREVPPNPPTAVALAAPPAAPASVCAVCFGPPPTHAALSCGHLYLCRSCAEGKPTVCGICAKPVIGLLHIFDAGAVM